MVGCYSLHREQLKLNIADCRSLGFDFWLAFVKFKYQDGLLEFQVYLLSGDRLNEDQDFRRVRRSKKDEEQIITGRIIEKAVIRFFSRDGAPSGSG